MVSAGWATRPCASRPGPLGGTARGLVRASLLSAGAAARGRARLALGSPSAPMAPWRWSSPLGFSVHRHGGAPRRAEWTDGMSRAGGTRTPNRRFWRPVLFQLSYCPRAVPRELSPRADGSPARERRPAQPASGSRPRRERVARTMRTGSPGGGGRGDAAEVGGSPTAQQRADRMALAGLLEPGQDVGEQAGGGLEHVGAQGVQGPQQLAVLDDLGLAAQALLDVAPCGAVELGRPSATAGQRLADARHTAWACSSVVASSLLRAGGTAVRGSLRRARCRRTLAADSEMPSSAAMASWGRS